MPPSQQWFLSKHEDGSIFGPLSFEQLRLSAPFKSPPSQRNQQRDLHHQFLRRDARKQISEMHGLFVNSGPVEEAKPAPTATRMSIGLQDRIRDLEQKSARGTSCLAEAEQRCAELERAPEIPVS